MNHKITVAAAILALITGCSSADDGCEAFVNCTAVGGGGGTLAVIEQDNALIILREAWFATAVTSSLPGFVVATGVGDMSGGIASGPGNAAKVAFRNRVVVAPFGPDTYNCPTSGTFIVGGDVADQNTVTTGDFSTYEFFSCDSGTGFITDGDLRADMNSIVGDPLSGQFEQDQLLTFTNFQATAGTAVIAFNGDHSALIDSTSAAELAVIFSGSSLLIDEQQISLSVRNFVGASYIQAAPPFNNSISIAGTASSTIVQGSFDFVTEETMEFPFGQDPTNGIFDVFGANGSTARVAVTTPMLVNIQVDANGSGNYEVSTQVSWDEFLNGNVILNWSDTGLN
jgi:hypothetical protein